jgi:hypothetical protein
VIDIPSTFHKYWDSRIDEYRKIKPDILSNIFIMNLLYDEAYNLWKDLHPEQEPLSWTYEHSNNLGKCGEEGIPHKMKRWNCFHTSCINEGCLYSI